MANRKTIAAFVILTLGIPAAGAASGLRHPPMSGAPGQTVAHRAAPPPSHEQSGKAKDYKSLVSALKKSGMTVRRGGRVSQPFFSVGGRTLNLDGESIQVFEYARASAAGRDAKRVEPSGSGIATSMPMWVGTPHFYKGGRLIVLYVGENSSVTKALENALGPQFAGK
jgi:hypothetical protein